MSCPRDDKPLSRHAVEGSEVRRCRTCHGLWVGYVALERLADLKVRRFLKLKARQAGSSVRLKCPADGRALVPVTVAGVEIDVCPDCKGTWLDHLELERIRARLRGKPEPEDDPVDPLETLGDVADLDPGFLKRAWRWVQDHLPDGWDDAGADFDLD